MAAHHQAFGIKIRRAIELDDALGNLIGMGSGSSLACSRKLFGHGLRMNAFGHVVMAFVAQDADNLGSQRFVQHTDGGSFRSAL